MEVPNIYLPFGSNVHQRVLSQEKISKHSQIFKNNVTSLLFIGCGDCKLFLELLAPSLPQSITRIVATDISQELIEAAKKKYGDLEPRITFKQLDLLNGKLDITETFDSIVSLWYIRWVHNMGVSLKNIKNLLNPNGVGLFMIEANNTYYNTVVRTLAEKEPWKAHLASIVRGISPFTDYKTAGKDISDAMKTHGLNVITCYSETNIYDYYSFPIMKDFIHRSYTAGTLIPQDKQEAFYKDVYYQMEANNCVSKQGGDLLNITLPVYVCVLTFKKE